MPQDSQRGFNISTFRASVADKNVARPNLYHVEFNLPIGLSNGLDNTQRNTATVRTLELWCEATGLPGVTVQTYQAQRYGYGTIQKRPLIPAFGEVMFDFIFDAQGDSHTLFADWINMIMNTNMSQGVASNSNIINSQGAQVSTQPFELAYRDDYTVDLSVYIYDPVGLIIKQLTLREAFPIAIGDARLAWADNNSYLRLITQFTYTDWFVQDVNQADRTPSVPGQYYNLIG